MLTRTVLTWAAAGAVAVGAVVGVAATRLPAREAVAGRGASGARIVPQPVGDSILAQNTIAQSTAQAVGAPNPGDDPRLDAWRIWLRSPNKGLTGPYTFWQIQSMKQGFGPTFAMPGNPIEERDLNGNVTRVIWDTLDSSIP